MGVEQHSKFRLRFVARKQLYIYIYIYIYMCVYVCVCNTEWKRWCTDVMLKILRPCYNNDTIVMTCFVFHDCSLLISASFIAGWRSYDHSAGTRRHMQWLTIVRCRSHVVIVWIALKAMTCKRRNDGDDEFIGKPWDLIGTPCKTRVEKQLLIGNP